MLPPLLNLLCGGCGLVVLGYRAERAGEARPSFPWPPGGAAGSCWKGQSQSVDTASQVLPAFLVIPVGYEMSF